MDTPATFEFICPSCGKNVKVRKPQTSGTYRITCPYCGESNHMQLPGLDEIEITAEPVAEAEAAAPEAAPAAAQTPKAEPNRARGVHRYPIQIPPEPGFKPKPGAGAGSDFGLKPGPAPRPGANPAGRPMPGSAPRPAARPMPEPAPAPRPEPAAPVVPPALRPAERPMAEPAPAPGPEPVAPVVPPAPRPAERPMVEPAPAPGREPVAPVVPPAPVYEASAPSLTTPLSSSINRNRMGNLVQLGRISNTTFKLKEGSNIIGRFDPADPGDINIKGDNTMSRRSVELNVQVSPAGIRYAVRVLKAANPVLLNERPLDPAFDRPFMNFGDILQLGQTKFRLDPA